MQGITSNTQGLSFNRIKWHILFWLVYIFSYTFMPIALGEDDSVIKDLQFVLLQLPLKIFATYTLVYYFLPRFILKKRYFAFVLLILPLSFILGLGQRYLMAAILYPIYYPESLEQWGLIYWPKVFYAAIETYAIAVVAAVIKLLKQWFQTQQLTNSLKQEKLAAELKFLKAQIHPHFLFNTLNNLYALTLKKSPKAPEVVLKLSDLLDYMLYECNVSKVTLEKEIKMLENYIELEKIRYGDDLKVEFSKEDDLSGFFISPMLLLPLVENSFKHGVSGEIHEKWIEINLNTQERTIKFSIENSRDINSSGKKESYTEGIGLKNVIRRLELVYKDKHQIKIDDKGESYKVVLTIDTTED